MSRSPVPSELQRTKCTLSNCMVQRWVNDMIAYEAKQKGQSIKVTIEAALTQFAQRIRTRMGKVS